MNELLSIAARETPGAAADGLQDAGESLIAALDHVPDVFVFVKDVTRAFVACSSPFLSLMGMTHRSQLYGKRDEDLSPPHLVEHYRRHDEEVILTGRPLIDLVELVRNADASYDWFLSSKTPWRLSDGRIAGVVGVTRALATRDPVAEQLVSLSPVIELISREYVRALTVSELAALVPLSPSHFTRIFRRHFGVSPYRYIRRVRVLAACDLLATTALPISAVAAQTGFYDASHFANDFRADRGMSPSAYRRRYSDAPRPARLMAFPRPAASGVVAAPRPGEPGG